MIHVCDQRQIRLLCAEPLESRRLLSGLASASPGVPSDIYEQPIGAAVAAPAASTASVTPRSHVVEVLEIESADDDEDDDDVEVSLAQLPREVLAALQTRFPGAKLVEAEFSVEDGDPEFEVAARFDDRLFDVALTPGGTIIEVEEVITSRELPQAVLDWVRQRFPGAEIDEAAIMRQDGVTSYEVVIAVEGGQEVEAVLLVQEVQTPTAASPPGEDSADAAATQSLRLVSDVAELAAPDAESAAPREPSPRQTHAPRVNRETSPAAAAGQVDAVNTADPTGATASDETIELVGTLPILVLSEPPAGWLPEIAGVLGDVIVIDTAALEQALQEVVHQIDSLAAATVAIVGDAGAGRAAFQFAAVVALIVGAHLLRLDTRIRTSALCWCFVLPPAHGGPPPTRRRRTPSRRGTPSGHGEP
jgi:uncharacterized membrane protein YkoI